MTNWPTILSPHLIVSHQIRWYMLVVYCYFAMFLEAHGRDAIRIEKHGNLQKSLTILQNCQCLSNLQHKKQEVCVEQQLKQMERVCKWVPILVPSHVWKQQWSKVLVVGGHSLWSQILCCQSNICHAWSCRFAMLAECLSQNGAVSQPWPSRPTLNADIARDKACEYSEHLPCTGKWLTFLDTIVVQNAGTSWLRSPCKSMARRRTWEANIFFRKMHKRLQFCSWNTWPPCKTQLFGNPVFSRKAYNALAHSSEMLRTRARQFHAHAPEPGGLGAQCCPLLFDALQSYERMTKKSTSWQKFILAFFRHPFISVSSRNSTFSKSMTYSNCKTSNTDRLNNWLEEILRNNEKHRTFLSTIFPHVSLNWQNSSRHGHGTTVATPPGEVRSSYHHLSPLSCKTLFDVCGQNMPTTLLVNPLRHLQ